MQRLVGLRYAYPTGNRADLIYAAVGNDKSKALETFNKWVDHNDLDDATFAEQRLLLPIISRFGDQLRSLDVYPRMVGVQRLSWSRAKLTSQENYLIIKELVNAGIDIAVIKGGAMVLLPYTSNRERISHDLDIVVPAMQLNLALDLFEKHEWKPSTGASYLRIIDNLSSFRSLNLFSDRFGDVDLHSIPFHHGQGASSEDQAFWERIKKVTHDGIELKIPCVEDRIAISIGHGGYDGHTHSDWMIDCAKAVLNEEIDWELLFKIITDRNIVVSAVIIFTYFDEVLNISIDPNFLSKLKKQTKKINTVNYYIALVQARPKVNFAGISKLLRFVAKSARKRIGKRAAKPTKPIQSVMKKYKLKTGFKAASHSIDTEVMNYENSQHVDLDKGSYRIELLIRLEPNSISRRIEFEINTKSEHVGTFKIRPLFVKGKQLLVRVEGYISIEKFAEYLVITSRDTNQLRVNASTENLQKYGALKFSIDECSIERIE